MQRYPGSYTLSEAYAEDAWLVFQHIGLLDADLGRGTAADAGGDD